MSCPEHTDPTNGATASARRTALLLIGLGLALSLGVIVLLALRLLPTGVPGEWEWPWRDASLSGSGRAWWVVPMCALPLVVLLWLLRRPTVSRRAAAGFVALCCLTAAGSIVVLETDEPVWPLHLATATASLPATGYFSFATATPDVHSIFAALSGESGQLSMPPRVQTHPPGPVLFYYVGLRVLEQVPELSLAVESWAARTYALTPARFQALSRWTAMPSVQAYHFAPAVILGLVCTLLGALLPLPVYLALQPLQGRRAGLIGALAAAAAPSVVVFIPGIDGVAAVLAMAPVALWLRGLAGRGYGWFVGAGVAMAAALFWSFGLLAVAVAMAASAIPSLRDPASRRRTVTGAVVVGAIVGVIFVLLLGGGYNVLGNIRVAVAWQSADIAHSKRSYLAWLPGNLYDVMLFMGPALLLTACAALPLVGRLSAPARCYLVGAFVSLGLVWVSGSTLGEVGRIWLFLMALLLPGAVMALSELGERTSRPLLVLLVLAQAVLIALLHDRLALVQA